MNTAAVALWVSIYVVAVLILAVYIIRNMRRSLLRSSVALGFLVLALPLALLISRAPSALVADYLLTLIPADKAAELSTAVPSLFEAAHAIAAMILPGILYGVVLLLLLIVFGVIGHFICVAIEKKKPAMAKKSKPIGAAIGAVAGLVLIVAWFTPLSGYLSLLHHSEIIHNELDQREQYEIMESEHTLEKMAKTPLLAGVRALGGGALFDGLTGATLDGEQTHLRNEVATIEVLLEEAIILTNTPIENYTDKEYDTIRQLADIFDMSTLLRVLGAESISSLASAWSEGEAFLGYCKPEMDPSAEVVVNVVLKRVKDSTKETIADDIRGIAPAAAAALKAYNRVLAIQSTPTTPSNPNQGSTTTPDQGGTTPDQGGTTTPDQGGTTTPDQGSTTVPDEGNTEPTTPESPESSALDDILGDYAPVLSELMEDLGDDQESKNLVIEIGIGILAQEFAQYIVTTPSTPATPDQGATTPDQGATTPDQGTTTPDQGSTTPDQGDTTVSAPTPTITQEQYNDVVSGVTDIVIGGALNESTETVTEQVKDLCDDVGIDVSSEDISKYVDQFMNHPLADLFK